MPFDRLDPARVLQAMKEQGIENPNQLAIKCGNVHRATAIRWTHGQMPEGRNLAVLLSVLKKSLPWLQGATSPTDPRPALVAALREQLGQEGDCPEADLVEAFGGFSFEQRKLLRQMILHGAAKVETITPLADKRGVTDSAAAETRPKHQRRRSK